MRYAKWEVPIRGAVLGTIFCLAYLAGWFNSLDQWYLPAGVRAAAFLLLPLRYWPFLIAGDCAAMLFQRVPRIPVNSAIWVYASSLVMPMLSVLAIASVREKFKTLPEQAKWLPAIAAYMAVWMALSTLAVNNAFGGPPDGITLEFFYVRCVGHFLTIVTALSLGMLLLSRQDKTPRQPHFLRDAFLMGVFLVLLFCMIVVPDTISGYKRIGLMLTMLVPIVYMTLKHGWRGAALGLAATCFATARTLAHLNTEGAYDAPLFVMQHTLVIASFGLLAIGHTISEHYAHARALGIETTAALQVSRTSFLVIEPRLREKAQTVEQAQQSIGSALRRLVEYSKSIGDFEGARLLNNEFVAHQARFGALVTDIYPLRIEREGLNAVLGSQEFSDARGGGTDVLPLLGPDPRQFSLDLQMVAYRCVECAIDVLSELQPRAYAVKTRIRRTTSRCGIVLVITARDAFEAHSTPISANAAIELFARVKAHGGLVKRRHANRISVWLPELKPPSATDQ